MNNGHARALYQARVGQSSFSDTDECSDYCSTKFSLGERFFSEENSKSEVEQIHRLKWSKWPVGGSKLPTIAALSGCTGSFLFGFIISLSSFVEEWVAAELYPCDLPAWDPSTWDPLSEIPIEQEDWGAIIIPSECYTLVKRKPLVDIAQMCTDEYSLEQRGANDCRGCVVPTPSSCDRCRYYSLIQTVCFMLCALLGAITVRFTIHELKLTNFFTMGMVVIGITLCIVSNSYHMFTIARSLTGIVVGGISVYVPLWISNYSPKNRKGFYGSLHQLFITIGILFPSILNYIGYNGVPQLKSFTYDGGPIYEVTTFHKLFWRVAVGITVLIVVLTNLLLWVYLNVKSPLDYVKLGRDDQCLESLLRIYSANLEVVNDQLRHLHRAVVRERSDMKYGLTLFRSLRNQQYRVLFAVVGVVSTIQQLSGINIYITSASNVLNDAGLSRYAIDGIEIGQLAINCIFTIPSLFLTDLWGRRRIMLVGAFGMLISAVLPVIGRFSDPEAHYAQILSLLGLFLFIASFAFGMGGVLWVWFTEVFPESLKLSGMCYVASVNWFFSTVIIVLNFFLHINISYLLFLGVGLVSWLFLVFCFKETRGMPQGVSPYLISHERAYHLDKQFQEYIKTS